VRLDRLLACREYAYHLTNRGNLARIARLKELTSTASLYAAAGEDLGALEVKRAGQRTIVVQGEPVHIRDQDPLHAGNVELNGGWDFARFCLYLNQHVFFWPGTADGPIAYGRNHFGRYEATSEELAFLRIPMAALAEANSPPGPKVCRYNSGSPRCNAGRGSPRGPETFVPVAEFPGIPSEVKEVVFEGTARLPLETTWSSASSGPYLPLAEFEAS